MSMSNHPSVQSMHDWSSEDDVPPRPEDYPFDTTVTRATASTPVGRFPHPLSDSFRTQLAACKSREDLFALVNETGFVNGDALREVELRGLYAEYVEWDRRRNPARYEDRNPRGYVLDGRHTTDNLRIFLDIPRDNA